VALDESIISIKIRVSILFSLSVLMKVSSDISVPGRKIEFIDIILAPALEKYSIVLLIDFALAFSNEITDLP
jgi:hypothetical protein